MHLIAVGLRRRDADPVGGADQKVDLDKLESIKTHHGRARLAGNTLGDWLATNPRALDTIDAEAARRRGGAAAAWRAGGATDSTSATMPPSARCSCSRSRSPNGCSKCGRRRCESTSSSSRTKPVRPRRSYRRARCRGRARALIARPDSCGPSVSATSVPVEPSWRSIATSWRRRVVSRRRRG